MNLGFNLAPNCPQCAYLQQLQMAAVTRETRGIFTGLETSDGHIEYIRPAFHVISKSL